MQVDTADPLPEDKQLLLGEPQPPLCNILFGETSWETLNFNVDSP